MFKREITVFKKIAFGFAAALLALGFGSTANASLLGQTVTCSFPDRFTCEPLTGGVVGGGTEFRVFELTQILGTEVRVDFWDIDLGENSISMRMLNAASSFGNFPVFRVTLGDLFWSNDPTATITGIANFTSNADVTGMEADDVSVVANALTIDFGGSIWRQGGLISFDLVTTHSALPEPATLALFGLGLGVLGFAMRRRRDSSNTQFNFG